MPVNAEMGSPPRIVLIRAPASRWFHASKRRESCPPVRQTWERTAYPIIGVWPGCAAQSFDNHRGLSRLSVVSVTSPRWS